MLKHLVFLLLTSFTLCALEVSIQSGKEQHEKFSTLHLRDESPFLCREILNDFKQVQEIICAFSKQPLRKVRPLRNDFFEITQEVKNETFFLRIRPFSRIKLFPVIFKLHNDETVFNITPKLADHWLVVGYNENLPFIKHEPKTETTINFPYINQNEMMPYVGGLDIQGNPVYIDKIQDVTDYIKIKKYYTNKQYDSCLNLIDEVIKKYPDSLFKNEFLFYEIKSYFNLHAYEQVIEIAKLFLREYSSDENVAEVLALVAKAYAITGLSVDSDYFFDRLFSEHADSEFANLGYIFKGETLEASGASSKALEFYEKALNATQEIDIAALAAYKLAFYKISYSNKLEAAEYIKKIVQAKSSFFVEDLQHSLSTMYLFVDEKDYETASMIAKSILDELDKSNEIYEELLSQRALWLAQTPNKQEALDAVNRYLTVYPNGLYEDQMQITKDGLFFSNNDENLTIKIERYNYLINEYAHDTIGDRAIYEKALVLLDHGMYDDLLGIKDQVLGLDTTIYSDTNEVIRKAAVGAMENALAQKRCQEVLVISSEYNVSISDKWDDGIYECAMMGGDYVLAKQSASKNLNSKNIEERKKWLYRYIDVDFTTGNYTDVLEASKDLITLIEDDNTLEYKNIYRIVFDVYRRLEDTQQMILSIAAIQKQYGTTYEDLDRYASVMAVGSELKDLNIIITYGNYVYDIQKSSQSYPQTPFVEFTLYQAYMDKEQYDKALEVIESLDRYKDLKQEERSRQKYLLGTVYDKLWRDRDADQAYDAAIEAQPESAWAKLAKSAKEF